jgi:hypothetical protein
MYGGSPTAGAAIAGIATGGTLAYTGAPVGLLTFVGVVLVLSGLLLVRLGRRRRVNR